MQTARAIDIYILSHWPEDAVYIQSSAFRTVFKSEKSGQQENVLCRVRIRVAGWYIYLKQSDMKGRFHSLGTSPSSANGHVLPSRYNAQGHGYTMTPIQFISDRIPA